MASAQPSFLTAVESLGATGYELLESVFEHAPFGVYIDDPTDGCTYANPFLLEQFGVPWADFEGFGWARSVVEEDVQRMQVAIQEYEHSRKPIHVTYRVLHADASVRWVHARVRAVVDADDQRVGSIGITTDITEQRRFEERVGSAQKLEAAGTLSARLAHDLNNLLTVMMASAESLEPVVATSPEHRGALDSIDLACEQARQLTEQLLMIAGGRVRTGSSCALDPELTRFARLLEGTLGEGVELDMHLAAEGAHVPLDPSSLAQIVLNLATNGRDAMDGRGNLRIETARDGNRATIVVQDEGEGMDEATAARAFDPFYTTKDEGRGTGLGLATIKDLIDVVGGSVRLDSLPGVGTSAVVILPAIVGAVASEAGPSADELPARPLRILILEDNEAVRQSVAYALALVGHAVESAGSVAHARARAATSEPFDILVSDVLLPDGSGVDFYHELRTAREIPVVFMSGFAGRDPDLLRGMTGPSEFIPKPFRPQEIVHAVSRVISSWDSRRVQA